MISVHSSGSRLSASVVDFTTSQNKMVMMRRSPFAGAAPEKALAGPSTPWKSGVPAGSSPGEKRVPQRRQNLASVGFSAEQDGQLRLSAVPHFMQNCASARLFVWQFVQSIEGGRMVLPALERVQRCYGPRRNSTQFEKPCRRPRSDAGCDR